MPNYHDICREMDDRGCFLTDEIGKCRRHASGALQENRNSRIDKYLLGSATYAASVAGRRLAEEFDNANAISGVLKWIESGKSRTSNREPVFVCFPILVDEKNGIVKQPNKDRYGLLEDVFGCLFRTAQDGALVSWEDSRVMENELWKEPSREEIARADHTLSKFGIESGSSKRFWQQHWRTRVETVWGDACVITRCTNRHLLRAAHIKRVAESNTRECLDEYNGLILVANVDLAFEHGLIAFSDSGEMLFSLAFSVQDRDAIGFPGNARLPSVPEQTKKYLQWHRGFHGFRDNI